MIGICGAEWRKGVVAGGGGGGGDGILKVHEERYQAYFDFFSSFVYSALSQ